MTYDDMVAVHINRDGMVTGVPWHGNWRWRWDCRGEVWHVNIGMRIPQHCVLMGMLPAAYGYQAVHRLNVCMPLSTASTVCMFKNNSIFKKYSSCSAWLAKYTQLHVVTQRKPFKRNRHILFTQPLVYTGFVAFPCAFFKVQALCHSDNSLLSIITCSLAFLVSPAHPQV
jgi:hypothetical protein